MKMNQSFQFFSNEVGFQNSVLTTNKLALILLGLLLSIDFLFILLHIILTFTSLLDDPKFALDLERGYPEMFQYFKEAFITVILIFLFFLTRKFVFIAWSLIMAYVFFDDSMQLHERVGNFLVDYCGVYDVFYLKAQDIGELAVSACTALFFISLLGLTFIHSNSNGRQVSLNLIILFLLLVVFGIGVDMLHSLVGGLLSVEENPVFKIHSASADTNIFTEGTEAPNLMFLIILKASGIIFEEGGEMIVMSMICWYIISLLRQRKNMYISLLNVVYKYFYLLLPSTLKKK